MTHTKGINAPTKPRNYLGEDSDTRFGRERFQGSYYVQITNANKVKKVPHQMPQQICDINKEIKLFKKIEILVEKYDK